MFAAGAHFVFAAGAYFVFAAGAHFVFAAGAYFVRCRCALCDRYKYAQQARAASDISLFSGDGII